MQFSGSSVAQQTSHRIPEGAGTERMRKHNSEEGLHSDFNLNLTGLVTRIIFELQILYLRLFFFCKRSLPCLTQHEPCCHARLQVGWSEFYPWI